MPALRQTSFAGGEMDPSLYGRDDIAQYNVGVKLAENFLINKQGAAISRGGFEMIHETKESVNPVNLYTFQFTSTIEYMLEFGYSGASGYIRFFRDGNIILDGLGNPYEKAFAALSVAEVPRLRFAQVGNTLFIVGAGLNGEIQQLVHDGFNDTDWALEDVDFQTLIPWYGPRPVVREPVEAETATVKAQKWTYQLTRVYRHPFGYDFESAPITVIETAQFENPPIGDPPADRLIELFANNTGSQPALTKAGKFMIAGNTPLELQWDIYPAGIADPEFPLVATRIYRGRGRLMGLVGEEPFPNDRFTDYGDTPNYQKPPPRGDPPFGLKQNNILIYAESPRAIGFFEQRLVLGQSLSAPGLLWLSGSNDYFNFDKRYFPTDIAPIPVQLASRIVEAIVHFVGLEKLLVFTTAGVWTVGSGSDNALSLMALPIVHLQSEIGCSSLTRPIVNGNSVVYVNNPGNGVFDLIFDSVKGGYLGGDLSYMAKHLFIGHEIKSVAHAHQPYGISYYVRDDGQILCLTYEKDYNIVAWSHLITDGTVENVATAIENKEHALYAAIRRTVGGVSVRFIERMATRTVTNVADAMCLDCATVKVDSGPFNFVSDLDYLVGRTVRVVGDGNYLGEFVVPVSGSIDLPVNVVKAFVGLPYTPKLQCLDLAGGLQTGALRTKQKTVNMATWEVVASLGLTTGEDFDNRQPWIARETADGTGAIPLRTGQVEVLIPHTYNRKGEVVLQQDLPHPVTVVGVTRTFDVGE